MTINAGTGPGTTRPDEPEAVFLRRTINDLERRLRAIESPAAASTRPAAPTRPATPVPGQVTQPPFTPPPVTQPAPSWTTGSSTPATPPPPPSPAAVAAASAVPHAPATPAGSAVPPTGYGVTLRSNGPGAEALLKWSGLLLVFLAAIFLVSTAIDRGWIGPELQLAGSFAIGGALVAGGLALENRRAGWATPLTSVGITVSAVCAVAGWQWLALASPGVWLGVACAVHTVALWSTRHLDRPGVGATGVAATTLAVTWIAELAPISAVLTAALAVSTMAMALLVRRPSLHITTIGTAFAAFFALAAAGDGPIAVTLTAGIATAAAIWFMPLAFAAAHRADELVGRRLGWATGPWIDASRRVLISLPALVGAAAALAARAGSHDSGLIMLATGAIGLASAASVCALTERSDITRRLATRSIWVSQVLGGAGAVFVGTALLLDGPALLASLIVQSAALLVFTRWTADTFVRVQAGVVTVVAGAFGLGRLLFGIERMLPWIDHATHLALVLVIAGWSRVETGARRTALEVTAYLGMMLWAVPTFVHLAQGQAAISAIWATLGLTTLVLGSLHGSSRAVQGGLATLAVVVTKALTVDLVDVDTFWRVGLFFVLGGAFLAVSYRFGSGLGTLAGATSDDDPLPRPPQRPNADQV